MSVRDDNHESAVSKGAAPVSQNSGQLAGSKGFLTLNWDVMRRFERVVALSDPKS